MTKVIEFKPDVPDIQSFTNDELALQTQTKFNEVYKLKRVAVMETADWRRIWRD